MLKNIQLTLVNPGLILELRFELVEQNHLLNDCLPFYCTFYKYESILLSYIKKKKKKMLQRKVYELLTLFRGLLGEIPGN